MRELSSISPSRRQRSQWAEALIQPTVWRCASVFGLPIGLLQAVLNQGDLWLRHAVNGAVIAKTIISPLVTFTVALISAAGNEVENRKKMVTTNSKEL